MHGYFCFSLSAAGKMETYRLMDITAVLRSRKITHWAIFGKSVERLNPLELYPWKTAWNIFLAFSLLLLIILSDLWVWWCTFWSKLIFSNWSVILYLEQWVKRIQFHIRLLMYFFQHAICCWSSWLPNPDVPWNSFFLFHDHNLGVEYNLIYKQNSYALMESRSTAARNPPVSYLCPWKVHLQLLRTPTMAVSVRKNKADLGLICYERWERESLNLKVLHHEPAGRLHTGTDFIAIRDCRGRNAVSPACCFNIMISCVSVMEPQATFKEGFHAEESVYCDCRIQALLTFWEEVAL